MVVLKDRDEVLQTHSNIMNNVNDVLPYKNGKKKEENIVQVNKSSCE